MEEQTSAVFILYLSTSSTSSNWGPALVFNGYVHVPPLRILRPITKPDSEQPVKVPKDDNLSRIHTSEQDLAFNSYLN